MTPVKNITRIYMNLFPINSSDKVEPEDDIKFVIILTVFLTLLSLLITISNLLTIVMVFTSRQLHKTTYYLIASLATADMLIGLTITPFFILWLLEHDLLQNPYICKMVLINSFFLTSASIVNLMTLTIERYLAICHTLFHKFLVSHEKTIKVIISTEWLICVLFTTISFFIGMKTNLTAKTCTYYQAFNEHFLQGALIIGVLIPFLSMFILYANILHATKKHLKLKYDLSNKLVTECPEQSEPKLQKVKHNHKMTITLCLILTSFVLSWGPFFAIIIIQAFFSSCTVPVIVKDFVILLGFMHSLTNPIIYTFRQPNIKTLLRQSIQCIQLKLLYFVSIYSTQSLT